MPTSSPIRKWIFLAGYYHSGTSLLQTILNQHPECTSPPVSHFLLNYVYAPQSDVKKAFADPVRISAILRADTKLRRLKINLTDVLKDHKGIVDPLLLFKNYMNRIAAINDKSILAEGASENIYYLRQLEAVFPDACVIHIIRDPRAAIYAHLTTPFGKKFQLNNLILGNLFMKTYTLAREAKATFGGRWLTLYFEDIIRNPEKEIKKICRLLQIEYTSALLNFTSESETAPEQQEMTFQKNEAEFTGTHFDFWKTAFSPEQIIQIEYICRDFFKEESSHYALSEYWETKTNLYIQKALIPYRKKLLQNKLSAAIYKSKWNDENYIDDLPTVERLKAYGIL